MISSNCSLGNESPADSGVCAYFELNGKRLAIPCDRWDGVKYNVQAIAKTIEAMRGIERYGAKHMIAAMFKGFLSLPAPKGKRPWREVMGATYQSYGQIDLSNLFKDRARLAHPDTGGSNEKMQELNQAYAEAKAEFGFK